MIAAVIAQVVKSFSELGIPTGITTDEVNAEIATQSVTVEAKIRKCSTQFNYLHVFLYFSVIKSLWFISLKR